jgi:hypothetical protein
MLNCILASETMETVGTIVFLRRKLAGESLSHLKALGDGKIVGNCTHADVHLPRQKRSLMPKLLR